ncbi:MAG: phage terminase large subunit family protein, partial [Endozoicomonas sp.]
GAQIALSTVGENFVGTTIYNKAGKIMYVMPTEAGARSVSNEKIAPMINDCPELAALVASPTSRTKTNTTFEKEFIGGRLKLTGATSPNQLRQSSIGKFILDEIDAYDVTIEGDPIPILEKRAITFGRKLKMICMSTPLIKGFSRIEARFKEGDQRQFHIPCPHCKHYQVLDWNRFNKVPGNVFMQCSNDECKKPIYEDQKHYFLPRGKWVRKFHRIRAAYEFEYEGRTFKKGFEYLIKVEDLKELVEADKVSDIKQLRASFHISSLYSPYGWYSWQQAVNEYLEAQGKPEKMQVFVNTVLGETWEDHVQYVEAEDLLKRREQICFKNPEAEVPERATTITCAVDTQNDRLEAVVVAWGLTEDNKAFERWVIDREIFYGDPAEEDVWNQLDAFRKKTYLSEHGHQMHINIVGVDSGGGRTQHVYDFCRKRQGVLALKGGQGENHPIAKNRSTVKTDHGEEVHLHWIGTFTCKSRIYTILQDEYSGFEKIHFPQEEWCNREFFEQLTAEKLITKYRKAVPYREWTKVRPRNEVLDLMVYNHALIYYVSSNPFKYLKSEQAKISTVSPGSQPVKKKKSRSNVKRSKHL